LIQLPIEDEMKTSYLDYAMSVIIGRALPDVRDGLKPVQRRILFAMYDIGNRANKPYKKSARVVGEVLGKYHPHGDMAVYDALVRMAQPFSFRYPLVDGQGNFGSIDGDSAAAMRYTEVRMSSIAEEFLKEIDKETVDFIPNFDGTLEEPIVLPTKVPNLLINGSSGIAVGMATNIPPHNLKEVINALIAMIEGKEKRDVLECIKGPDFPTGGVVLGEELIKAYELGRGRIKVRAKVEIDENEHAIRVKEIPYQTSKASIIEHIAKLVKEKVIKGIVNIQDRSDKEGIEIYIKLKHDANPHIVLNNLYKHTALETTFNIINLAIVDGVPKLLSLYDLLKQFLLFRKEIVKKRTMFELRTAKEKVHVLEGLEKALNKIDAVIKEVKSSKNPEQAKSKLITLLAITEKQAQAILDMKLQRLTSLEQGKLKAELKELREKINYYNEILNDEKKLMEVIKKELIEIKEKYGDERRTEIVYGEMQAKDVKAFIQDEEVLVFLTKNNYIKRVKLSDFRVQRRGGHGIVGVETYEDDIVMQVIVTSTHDELLLFSDKGRVFSLPIYQIPESTRYGRGRHIQNLLSLEENERIIIILPITKENADLIFITKHGIVKRTFLSMFKRIGKKGVKAIKVDKDDRVVDVLLSYGNDVILLATKKGLSLCFPKEEIRRMGRGARGVIGMRLTKSDEVVGGTILGKDVLVVSKKGYGKRTKKEDYRIQHKGGKGIITMRINEKTGEVVWIKGVEDRGEMVITTNSGRIIRIPIKDIRRCGRATMGVKLMKLRENERIASCTVINIDKGKDETHHKENV